MLEEGGNTESSDDAGDGVDDDLIAGRIDDLVDGRAEVVEEHENGEGEDEGGLTRVVRSLFHIEEERPEESEEDERRQAKNESIEVGGDSARVRDPGRSDADALGGSEYGKQIGEAHAEIGVEHGESNADKQQSGEKLEESCLVHGEELEDAAGEGVPEEEDIGRDEDEDGDEEGPGGLEGLAEEGTVQEDFGFDPGSRPEDEHREEGDADDGEVVSE